MKNSDIQRVISTFTPDEYQKIRLEARLKNAETVPSPRKRAAGTLIATCMLIALIAVPVWVMNTREDESFSPGATYNTPDEPPAGQKVLTYSDSQSVMNVTLELYIPEGENYTECFVLNISLDGGSNGYSVTREERFFNPYCIMADLTGDGVEEVILVAPFYDVPYEGNSIYLRTGISVYQRAEEAHNGFTHRIKEIFCFNSYKQDDVFLYFNIPSPEGNFGLGGDYAYNKTSIAAAAIPNGGKTALRIWHMVKETGGAVYEPYTDLLWDGGDWVVAEQGYSTVGGETDVGFIWPLPGYTNIAAPFGDRIHPVEGTVLTHEGIDIAAPKGTPVVAACGGVVETGEDEENGIFLWVRGEQTTYYACLSGYAEGLADGQTVEQGDVIGYVGSSGISTGSHLHFGVYENSAFVDPEPFLGS